MYSVKTRSPRQAIARATPCAVYKDCLHIFGGYDGLNRLNDFHEFDFSRKSWKLLPATGQVPSPRSRHVAVVYKDSFYEFAGSDGTAYVNDLSEYNFLTQTWSTVVVRGGTQPTPRGHLSALFYALLRGSTPPTPRASLSAVVYGMSMFCFGGGDDSGPKNDTHELNFETRTWSLVPVAGQVPQPRTNSSLVAFGDSGILFGGYDDSREFDDVHIFNFAQRTWSPLVTKGPAPTPRGGHVAVVYSNAMYVFGGENRTKMNDCHKLTLGPQKSCTWEVVAWVGELAFATSHHAAAMYKSSLIVFGGNDSIGYVNDFTQLHLGKDQTCRASFVSESTLLSDLRNLVNNEMMSDIAFVVEDSPIYAHKLLLCMRCDYFKAMLNGKMRQSRAREVVIDDVRHAIFRLFLEYVYTDDVGDVSLEDAMELFAVADRYGVERLQRICESHLLISLSVDNAAMILFAADHHNATELRGECVLFILNNLDEVSKSAAFAEMSSMNIELTLELLKAR